MVFLLIRFRTHSRQGRARIFISEEHKKSEPFSYREKVRIFMVWCDREDSNLQAPQLTGVTKGEQANKWRCNLFAVFPKFITGQIQIIAPDDAIAADIHTDASKSAVAVGATGSKGILPHKVRYAACFAHGVVQMAHSGCQVISISRPPPPAPAIPGIPHRWNQKTLSCPDSVRSFRPPRSSRGRTHRFSLKPLHT